MSFKPDGVCSDLWQNHTAAGKKLSGWEVGGGVGEGLGEGCGRGREEFWSLWLSTGTGSASWDTSCLFSSCTVYDTVNTLNVYFIFYF